MNKEQKITHLKKELENITQKEEKYRVQVLNPLINKKQEITQKLAEMTCPFIIGDIVTDGKQKYVITSIESSLIYGYLLYGKKIKKDGTPGKLIHDMYFIYMFSNNDWKVVKSQTEGE